MEEELLAHRLFRVTPVDELYKCPSAYLLAPQLCHWTPSIDEARRYLAQLNQQYKQFAETYRVGEYRYEEVPAHTPRLSNSQAFYYRVSNPATGEYLRAREKGVFLFTRTGTFYESYTDAAIFFTNLVKQVPDYKVHAYRIREVTFLDKLIALNDLLK